MLVVAIFGCGGLMWIGRDGGKSSAEEASVEEEPLAEAVESGDVGQAPMVKEEVVEEDEEAEEAAATVTTPTLNGIEECVIAGDGPFAGVEPAGVEITWWHQHSGPKEEGLLEMVDEFNQNNACGITVVAQNQGDYDDIRHKVNASIAAGELSASLIVGYQNDQAFYELNDALADLDPYLTNDVWGLAEEDRDDFFASFLEQSVHPGFEGQRLGFPPNRSMEVLYYNQTWLEELGFDDPPTTPEAFREMACAASNAEGTGGYILRDDASAIAAWTQANGGDLLAEDGESYNYANEATVEAMAFLKDLYDQGCAYFFTDGYPGPQFAARGAIFTQGSSAALPFYHSAIQTVAAELGREPDEWGITAIPHTVDHPRQNIYGADVMIAETTPERQLAAWIFTKWFTLPENQAQWVRIGNYFPTRHSTAEFLGDYAEENPQWATALDLLAFGTYEPQLISYDSVRNEASETFNTIIQLREDVGVDNSEPIVDMLEALTEFANEQQEELRAEIE